MSPVDIVLILIIVAFGLYGLWGGLIRRVSSLLGFVVGVWVTGVYFYPFTEILDNMLPLGERTASVVAFLILFVGVSSAASYIIYKLFSVIKFIPFASLADRIIGCIVGLLLGLIFEVVMFVALNYVSFGDTVYVWLEESVIAGYISQFGTVFLPQAIDIILKTRNLL